MRKFERSNSSVPVQTELGSDVKFTNEESWTLTFDICYSFYI